VEKEIKKNNRFIHWTPRIASILFLLFLTLFSLDVFSEGLNFWQTVLGLFMHNIPTLILLIILIISWKYEIVGGIAFILAGLLYILQMVLNRLSGPFEFYMISYAFIIAGPAFFIGILFLIGWNRKKKK
jgi:hypothetical protein